jgi:hypothetical protein
MATSLVLLMATAAGGGGSGGGERHSARSGPPGLGAMLTGEDEVVRAVMQDPAWVGAGGEDRAVRPDPPLQGDEGEWVGGSAGDSGKGRASVRGASRTASDQSWHSGDDSPPQGGPGMDWVGEGWEVATPDQSGVSTSLAERDAEAAALEAAIKDIRSELRTLKLSELQKRGAAAGVGLAEVFGAADSGEPKATLINLILAALRRSAEQQTTTTPSEGAHDHGALHQQQPTPPAASAAGSGPDAPAADTAKVATTTVPRQLQSGGFASTPQTTTQSCTVTADCSGRAILATTAFSSNATTRTCTCVCLAGYSGADCSIVDADCVGNWTACDANCTRRFSASAPAVGLGAACPTASEAPPCVAGDGACPHIAGGRAQARRVALRQQFQAKKSATAVALTALRARLQSLRSDNAALTSATRTRVALALNATTALQVDMLADRTNTLISSRQRLLQSDGDIARQQDLSRNEHVSHMRLTERAWQNSLSVVCNSTAGICDYDDTRNPQYPLHSRDTMYEHHSVNAATGSVTTGRRLIDKGSMNVTTEVGSFKSWERPDFSSGRTRGEKRGSFATTKASRQQSRQRQRQDKDPRVMAEQQRVAGRIVGE